MPESWDQPIQEVHSATSPQSCRALEITLKRTGLRIDLVEIINTGKGDLPYDCIFEGPDADPEAERFLPPEYKDT